MPRSRRRSPLSAAVAGVVAAGLALPTVGAGALTATSVTIADAPAYQQVVVAVAGGTLTGLERRVVAIDPAPGDGRSVVRVNGRGITATAKPVTRSGLGARIVRRPGAVLLRLQAPAGRHKFVSYAVDGSRTRLVVRLWRATTSPRARIIDDGCLRLTRWSGRAGGRAAGLELEPLFEHGLVISLRRAGAGAATVAQRPLTATEGTFLPDFSGYARPGRWSGRLRATPTTPPQPVMLEAWSASAKDGSLECLVQTPVIVRP
jgi:hypothetical protein